MTFFFVPEKFTSFFPPNFFVVFCQPVDWGWNRYADKKFQFMDNALVANVRSKKDKDATEFFKLLSLCHTVMVEHKDGNPKIPKLSRHYSFVAVMETQRRKRHRRMN